MPKSDDPSELVYEALRALQDVRADPAATAADRKAAKKAFDDVLLNFGNLQIQKMEQRTVLMGALVADLRQVIDGVQLDPMGATMKQVADIATRAADLYEKAKAEARDQG